MQMARTKGDLLVRCAESEDEDSCRFDLEELAGARAFYVENGYVVLRRLIPIDLCTRARAAFESQARRSKVPILRQHNMRYELNEFTESGFLKNPIFNIQDL